MKIVTYKIKIQYNLRIMKVIPTLSFITLIFLSAGCIRENRSGCGGYLSLKFRYTDSNGAPLTPGFPETDHLSVFVFDRQGIFVCERKDSALQLDHYMMEMPLPKADTSLSSGPVYPKVTGYLPMSLHKPISKISDYS